MVFQKLFPKKILGIDIGTSAIKIVELSGRGEKRKLENYGEIKAKIFYEKPFRRFEKNTLLLSGREISQAIRAIKEEAKIKTTHCVFSIPDFSTFFTNFELPPMTKDELPQAVVYEARQHVPLPLGEVTLDWEVISGKASNKERTPLEILLVAVPNEVLNQYQEIAKLSGLQILALEAEAFSLVRSLISTNEKDLISIIDIGARTTTCSIIDKRILKISHSFDLSGSDLIERIAQSFSVDYQTAQNLKEKYGLLDIPLPSLNGQTPPSGKSLKEVLLPSIDLFLIEIEKINRNFYETKGKEIQKFIIAGGEALLPGLKEYFANFLKKEVEIANPFSNISYPAILEDTLKEIGPSYAVAVGAALRGFE